MGRLVLLISFFLSVIPIYGQRSILHNILPIEEGLPKSAIYHLQQDQRGFLWIGTRDGLIRFDGTDTKTFNIKNGNLPINYCFNFYLDEDILWIGSNSDYQGVCAFNTQSLQYKLYSADPVNPELGPASDAVTCTKKYNDSTLILSTKDFQISFFNKNTKLFSHLDLKQHIKTNQQVVHVSDLMVHPYKKDHLIISCSAGIFEFDVEAGTSIQSFYNDLARPVNMIYSKNYPEQLWVATNVKGGLLKLDLNDFQRFTIYHQDTTFRIEPGFTWDPKNLSLFEGNDLAFKSNFEIWFPQIDGGLGVFNIEREEFDFNIFLSSHVNEDWTNTIHANEDGEVWLGTDRSGIGYFNGSENPLHFYFIKPLYSYRQSKVSGAIPFGDDHYLISLYKNPDFIVFDPNTEEIIQHKKLQNNSYLNDLVKIGDKTFFAASNGFGTINENLELEFLHDQSNPIPHNYQRLTLDSLDQLWMIDWNFGIVMYDDEHHYFPGGNKGTGLKNAWNHDITVAADGQVWIGSQNGLYRIDPQSLEITCLAHSDSLGPVLNANIKTLVFDDYGILWISSFGKGLTGLDVSAEQIQIKYHFDSRNGLPSDRVYDLIKDHNGNIWIWTNEGLSAMQQNSSGIEFRYYPETRNLNVDKNGIWFEHLPDHEIYFGFVKGFCVFSPDELLYLHSEKTITPVITHFTNLSDNKDLSDAIINHRVHLNPNQNQFNIQFSAPSFVNNHQVMFRYKLEGLQDDWIESNVKQINFSNVPSGKYVFNLEASSNKELWSSISQPLHISIATIWYDTWWAKLIWILLIGSFLLFVYWFFLSRQRIKGNLAYQKKEAANLRELNQVKSNFFTQISHDFRTPLTIILGMADRMKSSASKPPLGDVKAIEDNANILLDEIDRILNLARLESSNQKLNWQHGDVVGYIKFLTESFSSLLDIRNMKLSFHSSNPFIRTDYDPEILAQIINNLVSNAIKFAPDNSQIDVNVNRQNSYVSVDIIDNGPGISSVDLDHLFDPYYRGKNTEDKPGSGLGLALVKNWIELIEGDIHIDSELGQGTQVTIRLPLKNSPGVPIHAIIDRKHIDHETLQNETSNQVVTDLVTDIEDAPTLLIVEDHNQMADYIRSTLSDSFQCLVAYNGKSGLELAVENIPDIIVSDVMMPFMNGYELVNKIKANPLTDHIPMILVTAKADEASKLEGLKYGADAYITKPFNKNELLLILKNLYNLRSKNQKKFQQQVTGNAAVQEVVQDELLVRLNKFILSRPHDETTVDQLAGDLSMSRSQLYRKVKAVTGSSITRYIRQIRLHRALNFLKESTMNVSEIAYEVGYSDPNYFSRIFTEEFRFAPSDAKSQLKT